MEDMQRRVMYLEQTTGFNHNGPAYIAWVRFSKTGTTVYFLDRELRRWPGLIVGNHIDVATGDEWWVSGVKKNGEDRHWAGTGPVKIEEDARLEYERLTGRG